MRLENQVLAKGMAILFSVMLLMVAGCGDDETTNNNTITGSSTDPEYVAVRTQLDEFVDSTVTFFENGLNTIQGISDGDIIIPPQYAVVPEQQDSWDTSYVDGWHIIQIAYTHRNQSDEGVWQMSLTDSIQYSLNGVPQESWQNRDQLVFKHHWTYDVFDTTVTHSSIVGATDFTFSNLNSSFGTITGSRDITIHNKTVTNDSTVWRDFTFAADVNNVTVKNSTYTGWTNCPSSGSISVTVEMVYKKDTDDPVTTTWHATFTFSNGSLTASISKGNTVWSYTKNLCVVPQ